MRQARQHGRPGDLVAVQMQDREHGAVADRVEKFIGVPACRQRAGLGFAVADHTRGQQIGIVKHRAERVRQRVTQFAAFMD